MDFKAHNPCMKSIGATEYTLGSSLEQSISGRDDGISPRTSMNTEVVDSVISSSQLMRGESPFRLLQDYASDDNSENDNEPYPNEISPAPASPLLTASVTTFYTDCKNNKTTDMGSKIPCSNIEGFSPDSKSLSDNKAPELLPIYDTEANKTGNQGNQIYICPTASPNVVQEIDASNVDVTRKGGESEKDIKEKKAKLNSTPLRTDEFGRLVREGSSDSDSYDSRYTRKHYKRVRSPSRSQSPIKKRRRRSLRKSPWRRRDRRSRSRSWSPRPRRSRSRSPPYRRTSEFSGENTRRERGRTPGCFDFQRGRCYRGASCRYMHHDSSKSGGSRINGSKQTDLHPTRKNPIIRESSENLSMDVSNLQHDEIKSKGVPLSHDQPKKDGNTYLKIEESSRDDVRNVANQSSIRHQFSGERAENKEVQTLKDRHEDVTSCSSVNANVQEVVDPMPEKGFSFQDASNVDGRRPCGDTNSENLPSQFNISELRNTDCNSQWVDQTAIPRSSQDQTLITSPNECHRSEPFSDTISSIQLHPCTSSTNQLQSSQQFALPYLSYTGLSPPNFLASDFLHQPLRPPPPPPPPPPFSQDITTTSMPLLPRNSNFMPQASSFPFQHAPPGSFHNYQASLTNQSSQLSVLPSYSWTRGSQPQPPQDNSTVTAGTSNHGTRPHSQQACLSMQEPQRHFLNIEYFRSMPPVVPNVRNQSFVGPVLKREEHFGQSHVQGLDSSKFLAYTNLNPQLSFSQEYPVTKMQSSFGENCLPRDLLKPASHEFPYSQFQQLSYGLQLPAGGDQYDPLYDSIEPLSTSRRKTGHDKKWEHSSDSDTMLRSSGSHKPLDLEENNKCKEIGAVSSTTSPNNDEFGETADAEVGVVENDSPSNPTEDANMTAGEIEIDKVKSRGKRKKTKRSRSMKLFKVAIADFVKEILKPSWRQGNMSKEAFKTIVKKTVDKVSEAMKNHQIPKSQTKINQYIDSSQRKLMKLVMGYVDKYVKM